MPLNILLLEDEKPVREHFAAAISAHPDFNVIGAVGNCADALSLLKKTQPDMFISDLGLPDGEGVSVIDEATKLYPKIEVLVVTMFEDEEHVVKALEAGASGYVLKKEAFNNITEPMLCLMRGESALSPEIARFLLKRFKKEPLDENISQNNPLTKREHEVLTFIAKGYSYDEIADIVSISTNTVRTHIRNIYRKLSVKSRSEAVYEANQMGILKA